MSTRHYDYDKPTRHYNKHNRWVADVSFDKTRRDAAYYAAYLHFEHEYDYDDLPKDVAKLRQMYLDHSKYSARLRAQDEKDERDAKLFELYDGGRKMIGHRN